MNKFDVKFSVFDKNLKVRVEAVDEMHAIDYVKEIIKIHSIVPVQAESKSTGNGQTPPKNGTVDDFNKYFEDLLGGLGKK